MPKTPLLPRALVAWLCGRPARFLRREDGTLVMLSLFVFLAMIFVFGLAIDLIRYENERLRMQSTADRAVLAATMMREDADVPAGTPEQILRAYFAADGLTDQLGENFTINEDGDNGRVVTVVPAGTVPALFMQLLGVDSFGVATPAQAVEAFDAGKDIELVMVLDVSGSMSGTSKMGSMQAAAVDLATTLLGEAQTPGDVAITLVPYDTYVLPPTGFLNFFTNISGSGACNDWQTWSQVINSLTLATTRRSCDTSTWRTVRPFVSDPALATTYINALRPSSTTSIDLGVRYGALFFDPAIRPAITEMIANGEVNSAFAGRPYDWNASGVVRALILLTDGTNCCGERYGTLTQDANAISVCNALKDLGVLIYAIAYEAPPAGASLMQSCASSPSHYFNATADQIIEVFQGITSSIQSQALRLTL